MFGVPEMPAPITTTVEEATEAAMLCFVVLGDGGVYIRRRKVEVEMECEKHLNKLD